MISQISLQNFRSHAMTNHAYGRFNVLAGSMGAGKSSELHAMALIYTGMNPIVNAKGEGLRREIRLGSTGFHIALKCDQGVLDRVVTETKHQLGIDGEYRTLAANQGRIFERFHVSGEIIQALLDPKQFFLRDEKAQRKTLLQFMASKEVEAPAIVKKLNLATSFTTASQIDRLIGELKTVRIRDLNREIDTLQKQIGPPVASPKPRAPLDALLKDLRPRRDEILKKQAREEEWRRTLSELEEKAKGAANDTDLEKTLADLDSKEKGCQVALEALRKSYTKQKAAVAQGQDELAKLRAKVDGLAATRDTITGMGDKCGVIDVFDCPLHKKDRDKMVDGIKTQLAEAQSSHDTMRKALEAEAKGLYQAEAQGNEAVKALSAATAQKSQVSADLAAAREVHRQLTAHRASKPDTGDWPKELEAVSSKIASAEIDIQTISRQQEEASRRGIQVAEVQTKQATQNELSQAVEELAALKDRLLTESSGGFVASIQDFVKEFGFHKVEFSLEPFGFFLDGLTAEQLSGGQKVVLEAALRVAAAKQSGFNCLSLDDANIGEENRPKVMKLLYDSGCQVFLCQTTDKRPAAAKPVNGCRAFWFSNPSIVGPTKVEEIA